MNTTKRTVAALALVAVGGAIGTLLSRNHDQSPQLLTKAHAAGGVVQSPTTAAPERYVYYPVS